MNYYAKDPSHYRWQRWHWGCNRLPGRPTALYSLYYYLQNHAAANKIVTDIKSNGGQAFAFPADISREEEVENLFKSIDKQVGTITALVNNAGIIESQQKLVNMSAERLHKVFATNVIGAFFMCPGSL